MSRRPPHDPDRAARPRAGGLLARGGPRARDLDPRRRAGRVPDAGAGRGRAGAHDRQGAPAQPPARAPGLRARPGHGPTQPRRPRPDRAHHGLPAGARPRGRPRPDGPRLARARAQPASQDAEEDAACPLTNTAPATAAPPNASNTTSASSLERIRAWSPASYPSIQPSFSDSSTST